MTTVAFDLPVLAAEPDDPACIGEIHDWKVKPVFVVVMAGVRVTFCEKCYRGLFPPAMGVK